MAARVAACQPGILMESESLFSSRGLARRSPSPSARVPSVRRLVGRVFFLPASTSTSPAAALRDPDGKMCSPFAFAFGIASGRLLGVAYPIPPAHLLSAFPMRDSDHDVAFEGRKNRVTDQM